MQDNRRSTYLPSLPVFVRQFFRCTTHEKLSSNFRFVFKPYLFIVFSSFSVPLGRPVMRTIDVRFGRNEYELCRVINATTREIDKKKKHSKTEPAALPFRTDGRNAGKGCITVCRVLLRTRSIAFNAYTIHHIKAAIYYSRYIQSYLAGR